MVTELTSTFMLANKVQGDYVIETHVALLAAQDPARM
jgi:hypothetical protein